MEYCVNARQPAEVRKKADEIFINWKDREKILDLIVENPKGTYILEVPSNMEESELDLKEIKNYKSNIILAISDFKNINILKSYKIPFYWKYPLTSFWDLRKISNLVVCYILLDAPLYFDLKAVKRFGIPIRLVANLAYDNFIPCKEGIKGTYIRPEDVQYYEQYVDTIEFYAEGNKQEEALLKVYKEDQKWNGNLKLIIANLKYDVDNRGLPDEFGEIRIQCRQNCMRNGSCNFCETAFLFSRKLDQVKDEWVK